VSIIDHRPDLGTDYLRLADELLRRLGQTAARRRLKPLLDAAGDGAPAR
jgi:chromosome partitioning protein